MTGAVYRRCTKCGSNRQLKFYRSDKGRVCLKCQRTRSRSASRDQRVLNTYGLTATDYDRLFEAQGGRCAICGGTRKQRLSVDHCHKTLAIRGLLCRLCNGRLLTAARDNPEVLRRAANYLERFPATAVLGPRFAPVLSNEQSRRGR